tara:strand:+ start:1483 stop:1875 length:393 start_codon:yes stop_codon:yes gene_type:complete
VLLLLANELANEGFQYDELERWAASGRAVLIGAWRSRVLVGAIIVSDHGEFSYIQGVCTRAAARRSGVGCCLVQAAVDISCDRPVWAKIARANVASRELFVRAGFTRRCAGAAPSEIAIEHDEEYDVYEL